MPLVESALRGDAASDGTIGSRGDVLFDGKTWEPAAGIGKNTEQRLHGSMRLARARMVIGRP